jgi:two-component system phosphate regulon sensor histidine kinase PhoR
MPLAFDLKIGFIKPPTCSDSFLSFSRMERSKYSFNQQETDPKQVVERAIDNVHETFKNNNCSLSIEIEKDIPSIFADMEAMVTVIQNLMDNAFKYSKEDKQVVVRLTSQNSDVCFQVQDNGIGIASNQLKKVFKQFYQVDMCLSRETGGCGLGLSIVNYIVKTHKGSIEVKSGLGLGSIFTVRIPSIEN